MKIRDIKINGLVNPVGFSFLERSQEKSWLSVSWKICDTADRRQAYAKMELSETEDFRNVLFTKEGERLNSLGETMDFLPRPRTRYYVRLTVTGDGGDVGWGTAYFETAKMGETWTAKVIGTAKEDTFHPVFWRKFKAAHNVQKARLYVTGVGLYEACVNGQKAGDELLAPFCNDYREMVQYQTYDVTELVAGGQENVLEIITGNGWYKGRLGFGDDRAVYGDRFAAIAELHLWYENGDVEVIGTDGQWKYRESDIFMSDIYDGEGIDRLHRGREKLESRPVEILPMIKLAERYSMPVKEKISLPVKEIIHTPREETVLDMGQNFAGYMTFHVDSQNCPSGTRITLEHGEILQKGCFYRDNYRTAKAQFLYISDGREEWVRPHFTFYGFRYVRVRAEEETAPGIWEERPQIAERLAQTGAFCGKAVYSDMEDTISFVSSDRKLNRLVQNGIWGQRSNFLDIPTDCPQRNERLGWTGDAQVFAPTASMNMDTRAFYRKYLYDLRLEQVKHRGAMVHYVPDIGNGPYGSSVWGDVATFLPMTLYETYGDKEELRRHYPMMKDWTEWIIKGDQEHGGMHLWNFGFHFGDWLAQDGVTPQSRKGGTEDYLVATCYYYASVCKTAQAARILGYEEDADGYTQQAARIKEAFLEEYVTPKGRLAADTQTSYLLCLRFGLYRDKERIVKALKLRLKKDCYKIKGGFVGATQMCQVMAENGLENEAYDMLFHKGFPGWMHCIDLGATTIWERWNSVLDDGTVSGTGMNSLNHYAYGSVLEYIYRYIGGLRWAEPGYKKVVIAPQVNPKVTHAVLEYDSAAGKYVSEWRINQDGTLTVRVEIPFDCSGIVKLPGTQEQWKVGAGVHERTYMPSCNYRQLFHAGSRLEELQENEEAMALIKEILPIAYRQIQGQDAEELSFSLEDLKELGFMGYTPQMVEKAIKALEQLKIPKYFYTETGKQGKIKE